jgi:uncharacterized membrane protein
MRTTRYRQALALTVLLLAACRAGPVTNDPVENAGNAGAVSTTEANSAAPADPPPAAPPTARYRFTGTEPFWGGTIDGTTIIYKTPDDQAGETITATVTNEGATTRYGATLDGKPFVLKLTPGTCSDGMSDTVYPLHAVLAVRGEPRQGCASPIEASASSQTPPEAPAP